MAIEIKTGTGTTYDAEFYVWALEQAALLKERRFDDLDLENLIEEVEGLAESKLDAVLSTAPVIIEHLLKLQHSPATDPRNGWRRTVREHRRRLSIQLTPQLQRILAERLPGLYPGARDDAAAGMRDYGEHAAADGVPSACPYTFEQITGDWWP